MSDEKTRIGRTVRLTPDINDRLHALCHHLGTNPNSYLVNEIGKAIARDELVYKAQQGQADFFEKVLQQVIQGAGEDKPSK